MMPQLRPSLHTDWLQRFSLSLVPRDMPEQSWRDQRLLQPPRALRWGADLVRLETHAEADV